MALVILRCVFAMLAITLGFQLLQTDALAGDRAWLPWLGFFGVLLIAGGVLIADMFVRKKQLGTITAIFFGLIIGLFLTYVLQIALMPILPTEPEWLADWLLLAMAAVVCYTCISVLLQTQDDFRFIIPYVEFVKEIKGLRPYILDTSVVIDGRIADVVETRVIDNQLIMPQFVIAELQAIADSSDRLRRSRGRRGLDILNRLRSDPKVDLQVFDRDLICGSAGRPKAGAACEASGGQGRHERLQPEQGRQASRRGSDQSQRTLERTEAHFSARRISGGANHQDG